MLTFGTRKTVFACHTKAIHVNTILTVASRQTQPAVAVYAFASRVTLIAMTHALWPLRPSVQRTLIAGCLSYVLPENVVVLRVTVCDHWTLEAV
ncbi:hypothetical protein DPMN_133250 [Dreissena polymorpha]|uniref:Uncharacterized protein n=1 Tax=Dreissena polymorpha TaxID=45954 RepID=A0A9D4FXJ1_DREPO|nr:hypothetical protein DPMN_133250 [Dreissena polymorpha]